MYETRNTFYWITWEANTVSQGNVASFCNITKEKSLSEIIRKGDLETQTLFNFRRILCKKESEEVRIVIWTNFDGFTLTCLIQVACFKNFIFE